MAIKVPKIHDDFLGPDDVFGDDLTEGEHGNHTYVQLIYHDLSSEKSLSVYQKVNEIIDDKLDQNKFLCDLSSVFYSQHTGGLTIKLDFKENEEGLPKVTNNSLIHLFLNSIIEALPDELKPTY